MSYEWDNNKNRLNLKKHGIGFDIAITVFGDINLITYVDVKHSKYELRMHALGLTVNGVLLVVYIERNKNNRRIISARKANKKEREIYEKK